MDWYFILEIKKYFKYFHEINANSLIEKAYLFCSFLFYTKIIKHLKEYDFNNLIVFADMQPVDNLVSQYFGALGKDTITLQHGLFVNYEGFYNISSVSYKNVVSNHFLAWGNENKKLIQKYKPNCKVVVCGNPTIEPYRGDGQNSEFFTIFFDWDLFKNENVEMINIAYKVSDALGIKFNLRMHPSNDKSNYKIDESYLINNMDYKESMFMLGHTSSMIHICQRLGMPVFKYDTNVPSSPVHDKSLFKKSEDVLVKVKDINSYKDKYKNNIGPIGGESLECYRIFFNSIK